MSNHAMKNALEKLRKEAPTPELRVEAVDAAWCGFDVPGFGWVVTLFVAALFGLVLSIGWADDPGGDKTFNSVAADAYNRTLRAAVWPVRVASAICVGVGVCVIVWRRRRTRALLHSQQVGNRFLEAIYDPLVAKSIGFAEKCFREPLRQQTTSWHVVHPIPWPSWRPSSPRSHERTFKVPQAVELEAFFVTSQSLIVMPACKILEEGKIRQDPSPFMDLLATARNWVRTDNEEPELIGGRFESLSVVELYFSEMITVEYVHVAKDITEMRISLRDTRGIRIKTQPEVATRTLEALRASKAAAQ